MSERLLAWTGAKKREKAAAKLLKQTGHRERKTNWRTALSREQETDYLHKAWRFFDFLSWLVANGTHQELADFFAQPEQFRQRYRETALLFTDQIPVWLKVEAASTVVSEEKLAALRSGQKQRRARRAGAKRLARRVAAEAAGQPVAEEDLVDEPLPEEATGKEADSYLNRGPGSANADRSRITLIARQVIENFWNPAVAPVGEHLKGR